MTAEQNEKQLQESIKEYLEENPFPEDYAAQKVAYENLVERLLRLENQFNRHDFEFHSTQRQFNKSAPSGE